MKSPLQPYLKLKAASLVEVLVAMSLVSVIFTIGTMTWLQLNGPRAPFRELEYRMKARELLLEMEDDEIENAVVEDATVYYVQESEPLNPNQNLYEVSVTCFQKGGKLIFRRSRIIHRDED